MSFPKVLLIVTIILFGGIGIVGIWKSHHKKQSTQVVAAPVVTATSKKGEKKEAATLSPKAKENLSVKEEVPSIDLVDKLFVTDASQLPIVETLTYNSRVPWLKGRPAWISDYASYFETSRHFIARSINRKKDYFTQKITPGDRFTVLKKGVHFHIVIDVSTCKLWFYAIDPSLNQKHLLKIYSVGLGRKDSSRPSGCLSPIGIYYLGSKVAIYKPGVMGFFQDRKVEMIRVFGTRWIPLMEDKDGVAGKVKGYGIHGVPFDNDPKTGALFEKKETIGRFESDGCIRLAAEDMEEIFSIVVSRPTVVELVKKFQDAHISVSHTEIEKKTFKERG